MPPRNDPQQAFHFPKQKQDFTTSTGADRFVFYDIKFYPYSDPPTTEPVFGVVSQSRVYIGRLSAEHEAVITILHELEDEQEAQGPVESSGLNSCSWCYVKREQPLLAITGDSGQLKVIDAVAGKLFTTFVGHGKGTINDVVTHPLYPWILATASIDQSVRIWDLRRHNYRHESPTIIICGQATGHSEGILTLSWHSTGRYLLTGGLDERVCVWTIPDLANDSAFWQDIAPGKRKRSSHEVHVIHFPHFVTSAVHSNYVDCVRFFGDLVISKACEEGKIVVWKITGFDSSKKPPDAATAPKIESFLDTRNGFMRSAAADKNGVEINELAPEYHGQPPYERLLELESPKSNKFYLRFGLLLPSPRYPDLHPTLVFGSEDSMVRFWDLDRLSSGQPGGPEKRKPVAAKNKKKTLLKTDRANGTPQLVLESSTVSSTSSMISGPSSHIASSTEATSENSADPSANGPDPQFRVPDRQHHPIHDPHQPIGCHAKLYLDSLQYRGQRLFLTRTSEWSPCGRWCIVVGESRMESGDGWGGFAVLHR